MQILKSNCIFNREWCKAGLKGFLFVNVTGKFQHWIWQLFGDTWKAWQCHWYQGMTSLIIGIILQNSPPHRHHGVCWPVTPPTDSYKRASKPVFILHCSTVSQGTKNLHCTTSKIKNKNKQTINQQASKPLFILHCSAVASTVVVKSSVMVVCLRNSGMCNVILVWYSCAKELQWYESEIDSTLRFISAHPNKQYKSKLSPIMWFKDSNCTIYNQNQNI